MGEQQTINQDEYQLRLLTIFHYVCAGLAALFACLPLFHVLFGLLMLFAPGAFEGEPAEAVRIMGLIFIVLPGLIFLLGWVFAALLAWAGHCIAQRKRYTFCLVMAGVACMLVPFGTALGIFSIIVLTRPGVKALFVA